MDSSSKKVLSSSHSLKQGQKPANLVQNRHIATPMEHDYISLSDSSESKSISKNLRDLSLTDEIKNKNKIPFK